MAEWTNNPWIIAGVSIGLLALLYAIGRGLFALGEWVGRVNTDQTTFKDFMKEMRADIKEILLRLSSTPTATSASPIQLTEFGQEISHELKVKEWVPTQAEVLLERARGMQEHEVYDLCMDHVQSRTDEEKTLRDAIRASAYQHGIDVAQVQRVYVIELRDALLKLL